MASNKILFDLKEGNKDPLKILRQRMFECLKQTNSVELLKSLISRAQAIDPSFKIQFRDSFGFSVLGNAINLHQMPLIKFLVEKCDFFVKEELIYAVDIGYKEAVDYLITWDPELLNRPVLTGTTYKPGVSPVMIAAMNENEQMLKFLFSRGAVPLEIPNYDPTESRNIIRFDAIYQTVHALSQPVYLCIMNEDPIMVAFKISESCERISLYIDVAKKDFSDIRDRCEQFAADFIKHVTTFDELQLILSQMTATEEHIVAPGEPWERLRYAMTNNHRKFVANSSVQKLIKKKFFEGPLALQDFESSHILKRVLFVFFLSLLTPIWIFFNLLVPEQKSSAGNWINSFVEMPLMRFIVQIVFYVLVVFMTVANTVSWNAFDTGTIYRLGEDYLWFWEYADFYADYLMEILNFYYDYTYYYIDVIAESYNEYFNNLGKLTLQRVESLYQSTVTDDWFSYLTDAYISLWTFGNVVSEMVDIWSNGFRSYSSDWVNRLNFFLNFTFMLSIFLKYSYIIKQGGYYPPGLYSHNFAHPLDVAEVCRSLGMLFLIFKVFKLGRVTEVIGKPQHFLGCAFSSGAKFFAIFLCALVGFSVAQNGIIHNTYKEYFKNCLLEKGQGVNVQCVLRLMRPHGDELPIFNVMDGYQSLAKVWGDLLFTLFKPDNRLANMFPRFENPQEWVLMAVYTIYAFCLVVVGLNLLKSLIISAVLGALKRENEMYLFRRTMHYFNFISGQNVMPPPFNVFPSVRQIRRAFDSVNARRGEKKSKIFSEDELNEIVKIRSLMQRLKNTYMREYKKSSRAVPTNSEDMEMFKNKVFSRADKLVHDVTLLQTRTQDLISVGGKHKSILNGGPNSDIVTETIANNSYLQKYPKKYKNFQGALNALVKKK